MSQATWSIHTREGRRHRVAYLTTAHEGVRSYERMSPGQASVTVARNDLQLSLDTLRLDHLLVCESPRTPPWVGPITSLREGLGGFITLSAEGLPVLLDGEPMPQEETYSSGVGSGAIVQSVLRNGNRREHTGICAGRISAGPSIVDFALGGMVGLQALDELASRSNWEWSVRYAVAPSGIEAFLDWTAHQGEDVSNRVHLYEGRDFVELTYGLDLASLKDAVTSLGGSGVVGERTSATATGSERVVRMLRSFRVGSHRRLSLDPTTDSVTELRRSSERDQERALSAAETLECVVNANSDWRDLAVGNYATFGFKTTLSGNAFRVMRIVGAQPTDEEGICALTLEGALL